jgi:hypothetical protein
MVNKMKDMKELFAKKKKISDVEKEAKMGVLKEVSDMAGAAMGDKLKGLKKVTVASDSKEGLDKGLEKAKELLDKDLAKSEDEEGPCAECGKEPCCCDEHEASESPEHEKMEDSSEKSPDEMSAEELKAKIEELQEKLAKKA